MSELVGELQGIRPDALRTQPALKRIVDTIFGVDDEDIQAVIARARQLLPQRKVVVWEADPLTFTFTYVSPEAEALLGYPAAQWCSPGFWQSQVVHPDDVADAISHCAVATAAGADHDFEYRARTAQGGLLRVHDVVHVLKGPLGFATCLRGIMFAVQDAEAI
jgi:PAS domain-containing protein